MNIADLTDDQLLKMLENFPSRNDIKTAADLTDDEINSMQKSLAEPLAPSLYRDSKYFDTYMNNQENWKKLIIKEGIKVPTDEDLVKLEIQSFREYYLKKSRSSMGFFNKAAKGAVNPGEVIGNSMAGMLTGMNEMVSAIEKSAKEPNAQNANPLAFMQDLNKGQDGQPNEVNPFELMGRILGGFVVASARAEARSATASTSDNPATAAENTPEDDTQPTIQCAQQ